MSVLGFIQVWWVGTLSFVLFSGISAYLADRDGDLESRRFFARAILASPIWPLVIIVAAWNVLRTLVRWAR